MEAARRVERVESRSRVHRFGGLDAGADDRGASFVHTGRDRVVAVVEARRQGSAVRGARIGTEPLDQVDVTPVVAEGELRVGRTPGFDHVGKPVQAQMPYQFHRELDPQRLQRVVLAETVGHEGVAPQKADRTGHRATTLSIDVAVIEADLVVHGIGQLVTCEPTQGEGPLGLLENAAVASRQGQIVWVGPTTRWQGRLQLPAHATIVDAEGCCVLPGFVDAHSHLLWAGSRADEYAARIRGQPYWGGGIMRSVRATREAGLDDLLKAARRRLRGYLRHGVTALEVKSGFGLDVETEERLLRVGVRLADETPQRIVTTFYGAHVVPDGVPTEDYMAELLNVMIPRFRPLAAFCDAWCDPGAFTAPQCRRILNKAHGFGYQLKLHASQLAPGDGPRLAVELGATSVDHLDYLRDSDARLLAESSVVCVICPGTTANLRLAGEGSARALAAAGCQLAIATDHNPGTCCSENMSLMIGLACQELGLSPEEALRGATLGGARALRLQRQNGSVRLGKRCDLLLLDAESYLEIPYRLGVNLVETTICQGRVVTP